MPCAIPKNRPTSNQRHQANFLIDKIYFALNIMIN